MTTDTAGESSSDEVTQLHACLTDLATLMASPTLWNDGKPPRALSTVVDALISRANALTAVHERFRNEVAERRQFRLLVETIPALVWRGTPDGQLDYLNQRAVEYLGHTAEGLANGGWMSLVHPDHQDATVQLWLQSVTTGSLYEYVYRLRRANGE